MPVEYLKETPSQTAGPYVHIGTLPGHAGLPIRQNETLNVIEAPGDCSPSRKVVSKMMSLSLLMAASVVVNVRY